MNPEYSEYVFGIIVYTFLLNKRSNITTELSKNHSLSWMRNIAGSTRQMARTLCAPTGDTHGPTSVPTRTDNRKKRTFYFMAPISIDDKFHRKRDEAELNGSLLFFYRITAYSVHSQSYFPGLIFLYIYTKTLLAINVQENHL